MKCHSELMKEDSPGETEQLEQLCSGSQYSIVGTSSSEDNIESSTNEIAAPYISSGRILGTSTHNLVMQQAELVSSHNLADFPGKEAGQEWAFLDPPDSKYSWLILLFCIIIQLAAGTLVGTVGLFLVEFLETFEGNELGYSWVCTIQQTLIFVSGPVSGLLADKVGVRPTVIAGCIGTSTSLILASLTSNFTVLLFTYGILAGLLTGFILIPTAVCAGDYFIQHKVLALTASTCCWPLLFLAATPTASAAIQSFGWRTTMVGIACIIMQATVLAALLWPRRLSSKFKFQEESRSDLIGLSEQEGPSNSKPNFLEAQDQLLLNDDTSVLLLESQTDMNVSISSYLVPAKTASPVNYTTPSHCNTEKSFDSRHEENREAVAYVNNCKGSNGAENAKPEEETNSLLSPFIDNEINFTQLLSSESKSTKCCIQSKPHPVVHWRMMILIAHNVLWGYSSSTFFILLPELCKSLSIDSTKVSHLFMIVGITGFVGRLSTILLCRAVTNFGMGFGTLVTMLIQSGAMFGLTFTSSFEWFAVLVGIFNLAYGSAACLVTPAILELHGNHYLATVYGIEMLFFGAGILVSTPFSSYMFQKFGTYSIGFQVAAGASTFGALVYLPHVIVKWKAEQSNKPETNLAPKPTSFSDSSVPQ